ncbi:MAG: hypothetical protein ACKVE4_07045 [Dissulfuribacterales bacterium]
MAGKILSAIERIERNIARQWRIEYSGVLYHILPRGNERQEIFRSDDDRKMSLELIGEFSARFQIDVFVYVLMGNQIIICCIGPGMGTFQKVCSGWGQSIHGKLTSRWQKRPSVSWPI